MIWSYNIQGNNNMFRGRKYKNTLDDIGKIEFNFDLQFEKIIYNYLCHTHQKEKIIKDLEDKYKFKSYREWKRYIYIKYIKYNDQEFIEFSRYLNLRIRNIRPIQEYWSIVVTVVLTIVITELFNFKLYQSYFTETSIYILILALFIVLLFLFGIICLVWNTLKPMMDYSLEQNLLCDYKEIIDNIIEEKNISN